MCWRTVDLRAARSRRSRARARGSPVAGQAVPGARGAVRRRRDRDDAVACGPGSSPRPRRCRSRPTASESRPATPTPTRAISCSCSRCGGCRDRAANCSATSRRSNTRRRSSTRTPTTSGRSSRCSRWRPIDPTGLAPRSTGCWSSGLRTLPESSAWLPALFCVAEAATYLDDREAAEAGRRAARAVRVAADRRVARCRVLRCHGTFARPRPPDARRSRRRGHRVRRGDPSEPPARARADGRDHPRRSRPDAVAHETGRVTERARLTLYDAAIPRRATMDMDARAGAVAGRGRSAREAPARPARRSSARPRPLGGRTRRRGRGRRRQRRHGLPRDAPAPPARRRAGRAPDRCGRGARRRSPCSTNAPVRRIAARWRSCAARSTKPTRTPTSNGPPPRRAEFDALLEELTRVVRPGGRSRAFTGADERARTSVQKALRRAIAAIGAERAQARGRADAFDPDRLRLPLRAGRSSRVLARALRSRRDRRRRKSFARRRASLAHCSGS